MKNKVVNRQRIAQRQRWSIGRYFALELYGKSPRAAETMVKEQTDSKIYAKNRP